jgi:hypothetical protein
MQSLQVTWTGPGLARRVEAGTATFSVVKGTPRLVTVTAEQEALLRNVHGLEVVAAPLPIASPAKLAAAAALKAKAKPAGPTDKLADKAGKKATSKPDAKDAKDAKGGSNG